MLGPRHPRGNLCWTAAMRIDRKCAHPERCKLYREIFFLSYSLLSTCCCWAEDHRPCSRQWCPQVEGWSQHTVHPDPRLDGQINSVLNPDPELFGQIGSGPGVELFGKKICIISASFLQKGLIHLWLHTYFQRKSLKGLKSLAAAPLQYVLVHLKFANYLVGLFTESCIKEGKGCRIGLPFPHASFLANIVICPLHEIFTIWIKKWARPENKTRI